MSRLFYYDADCFPFSWRRLRAAPPPVTTVPVSGKSTVDGQPVTTGRFLSPRPMTKWARFCVREASAPDGEYTFLRNGKARRAVGKVQGDRTLR